MQGKSNSLSTNSEPPFYLDKNNMFTSKKGFYCQTCESNWGIDQAVWTDISKDNKRPFEGHFIIPLELHENLTVHHGTDPCNKESIRKKGLLPPRFQDDKTNGLLSEKDLVYTGRTKEPAKIHAIDDCILDFTYSGYLAITKLPCGSGLNTLFKQLPKIIRGVQYKEAGESIAFKNTENWSLKL